VRALAGSPPRAEAVTLAAGSGDRRRTGRRQTRAQSAARALTADATRAGALERELTVVYSTVAPGWDLLSFSEVYKMLWPFYIVAVNHALYKLGIEPHLVPTNIRRDAQIKGTRGSYTPQEMAMAIAYFLGDGSIPHSARDIARHTIDEWLRKGKVRPAVLNKFSRAAEEK